MPNFHQAWQSVWTHERSSLGIKATLSLSAFVVASTLAHRPDWLSGSVLGVIAAALADVEDSPRGRVRAIVVTLLSFCATAFLVRLSYPHPLLFATVLTTSAFVYVMLGAVSERYERIVTASLILAIYTTLRIHQSTQLGAVWTAPLQLLAGAAGYSVLSLAWTLAFSIRPVRHSLAQVYSELSACFAIKGDMLRPISGRDLAPLDLALTRKNGQLVFAMNTTRQLLVRGMAKGGDSPQSRRLSELYFLAQELHERVSSSHQSYDELARSLARSDFLFRCAHLTELQATNCERLAFAIARDEPCKLEPASDLALHDLELALAHVQAHLGPSKRDLAETLHGLVENLAKVQHELRAASSGQGLSVQRDTSLKSSDPGSLGEAWQRVRMELTPSSGRFRHALRLTLSLLLSYVAMQFFPLVKGYWVLLTAVFVLQRTYSATWRRLGQRVAGTVVGLLASWVVLRLQLGQPLELLVLVAMGVVFLLNRAVHYTLATAAITVLVFVSLDQVAHVTNLLLPRLVDTVLGAAIAAFAIAFILPDWQGKRLHLAMARSLRATSRYLGAVIEQYASGKDDHLSYRSARREAHNADAELSSMLTAMLGEPNQHQLSATESFSFLGTSHKMLAYVSALGAHREELSSASMLERIRGESTHLTHMLDQVADAYAQRATIALPQLESGDHSLPSLLGTDAEPGSSDASARSVLRQLQLMRQLLPQYCALSMHLWSAPKAASTLPPS